MHKLFKIYLAFVFLLAATSVCAYLIVKNSYSADQAFIASGLDTCPAPTTDTDTATEAEKQAIALAEEPQSAKANEQTSFSDIFVSLATSKLQIKSKEKIKIDLSTSDTTDLEKIDHISVFATLAGQKLEPTKDDAGKKQICSLVGTPKDQSPKPPLGRLIGSSSCDAYGDCGSVYFDQPSQVGAHQIFAVAMKSSKTTACDPANILGWSTNSENTITVYDASYISGSVLSLDVPSNVAADKEFTIHATTNPLGTTRTIDHVSILVLRKDSGVDWLSIDEKKVCELADANVKAQLVCTAGNCNSDISLSLSQSGQHRIIGVAMESLATEKCAEANIIAINKDGIITVASSADPAGDGTDDGKGEETTTDGGSGSSGSSEVSKWGDILPDWLAGLQVSKLRTIPQALGRIGSIGLAILGFVAVLAIVLAGMKYITAGGDQQKAQTAKKAVLFAVYGIIAATIAVMLVKTTVLEARQLFGEKLAIGTGTFGETVITPSSDTTGGIGGPNASILSIFGHKEGIIWRIIRLAVSWSEVVAFFMILWASYLYMTSFGEDSKAESAKKTLIWAVIGLAVILSADVIVNSLGQLLT